MTDEEEWGPWQNHDGMGCPCVGMWAQWTWNDGTLREGIAGINCVSVKTGRASARVGRARNAWRWSENPPRRVIRYRIRKPRALRELIDMVENLPVEEDA